MLVSLHEPMPFEYTAKVNKEMSLSHIYRASNDKDTSQHKMKEVIHYIELILAAGVKRQLIF